MDSYLKENFDRLSKNLTVERRKFCGVVKNPKRRLRFIAKLPKRLAAQAMRRTNQGSVDGLPEVSPVEIDSESGTCETDTLLGEETGEAHGISVGRPSEVSTVEIDSESGTCETDALLSEKTGSGQSSRSFGSTDDIYHQDAPEIHGGLRISISSPSSPNFIQEISSPSVTDIVLDVGHDQEVGPTVEPTASEKQNVPQPWAKVIVVMAFTSIVGLLSVSYKINGNGNLTPGELFKGRPVSFGFFLLVVMITFFISIIAMIIRPVLPLIAKVLNIMAFVCVVLGVTVLLWAMLPKSISWVTWIFFAVTILITFGVIVYEWFVYVKKVKEKGTTLRPTT